MKKLLTPLITYAIDKAKKNKLIQNLFESPFELEKYPKMGTFTDSFGDEYELRDGLRTKIRPSWRKMLEDAKVDLSDDFLNRQMDHGRIAVEKMSPVIESMGKNINGSNILEVGCHSGGTSFALAENGASYVMGTEYAGYKVEAVDMESSEMENQLIEVNDDLNLTRERLADKFQIHSSVEFQDDDICSTRLPKNSFDIVMSWEVIEHLHDTGAAFKSMYEVTSPGGIMVHEYNPFFCLNGGHSLCTLDMLWGHTRLSNEDFARYLDELRPQEKERALSFYRKGLNRTTLADLNDEVSSAGWSDIAIIPFSKEQHLRMIDQDILRQTRRHYPKVTLQDLCTPRVYVIARKAK